MAFNTPWGRLRFVHLPCGLACAQDVFKWMMDQILTCCDGVTGIADDVVVHGKDDKEHDKHVHKFVRFTCEHGLVFNKDKCAVKQTSVVFFKCVYDANGAHPNPKKVSAVHKMLASETAAQLQKFLRLVTYLSPFIPSLSSFIAPLHGLLKKGTEFIWNISYQEAFDKVKSIVCKDTTLQYFNICKPVTVQVNTSQKGLGAALLQHGCPLAFASKAFTPVKQCCANIECELLSCVFGAEWFHTYVFGCAFTIESDHKPPEQISIKILADTPVHLQRMLLRLQIYDFTIKYWPGKEMLVADALSHYASLKAPEIPLNITINDVHITPDRKTEFQTLIPDGLLLHSLAEMIIAGWPDDTNDVPCALCPYHGHRNTLTVEDSLILQVEALIIPLSEREKILQAIHKGHMGISKCQNRARHCVLTWNQLRHQMPHWIMPNMPMSQPTGTTTAAPANMGPGMAMATPWCWLLPLWWIWILSCYGLLFQDAYHQKDLCISIQCLWDQSWKNSLQKMLSQRYCILTIAPSLPMHSSLSLQQTGG